MDFIICHKQSDHTWADWLNQELGKAGFATQCKVWEYGRCEEYLSDLRKAAKQSTGVITILSKSFLDSVHGSPAWMSALKNSEFPVLPVRVQQCVVGDWLNLHPYIDFHKLGEEEGRSQLLEWIEKRFNKKPRPVTILFDDSDTDIGGANTVSIQHLIRKRNPRFIGREKELTGLAKTLEERRQVVLFQETRGLGGVGRTELASEYAYRYSHLYDLVWWIRAEDPWTLSADFERLAWELDLKDKTARNQELVTKAVRTWLSQHSRWLLIFDTARTPDDLLPYVRNRYPGHVLITSRSDKWPDHLAKIGVGPLPRPEATNLILRCTKEVFQGSASTVAAALNDMPLAINLAGSYVNAARSSLDDLYDLFQQRCSDFWPDRGIHANEMIVVGTLISLAADYLQTHTPGALDILKVCAYLAPNDISLAYLCSDIKNLPSKALARTLSSTARLNQAMAALERFQLIHNLKDRFRVHPMVQTTLRGWIETDLGAVSNAPLHTFLKTLRPERKEQKNPAIWAEAALALATDLFPEEIREPESWATVSDVMPHRYAIMQHSLRMRLNPMKAATLTKQMADYMKLRLNLSAARQALERTQAFQELMKPPNPKLLAETLRDLGAVHRAQSQFDEAREAFEGALEISRKLYGNNHADVAGDIANLGHLLEDLGDWHRARKLYKEALEINIRVSGLHSKDTVRDYCNLGLISQRMGDIVEAWEEFRHALDVAETVYGKDHERVTSIAKNVAGLLTELGDWNQSKIYYLQALEVDLKLYGADHSELAKTHNNLGTVYQRMGNFQEAVRHYKSALRINRTIYGTKHPKTAIALNNVAGIMHAAGRLDEARAHYKSALEILVAVFGPDHPNTQTVQRNLAKLKE